MLVTADGGWRRGSVVPLKVNVDVALASTQSIEHAVVRRTEDDVPMTEGRDHWYHDLMADADPDCPPERMDSGDLLYLLYTSGTTVAKGIMHTTGATPPMSPSRTSTSSISIPSVTCTGARRHRPGHRAQLHRLRAALQRGHVGDLRGHTGPPAQGAAVETPSATAPPSSTPPRRPSGPS